MNNQILSGKAWVFGDEINSDVMAPGIYFKESMSIMASHCLEAVDPSFAQNVKPGDIIVAGRNFGVGSAREQAALAFKELKVGAIIAKSYARIFYRNTLNFGLPALICNFTDEIDSEDQLEINPISGEIRNLTKEYSKNVPPIPEHLMEMISLGGLMPYLETKIINGDLKVRKHNSEPR